MSWNKTDQKQRGPLLKKIIVTSTTGKEKEESLGLHIRKQTSSVKKGKEGQHRRRETCYIHSLTDLQAPTWQR